MFCICVLIVAAATVYMVEAYIHTYPQDGPWYELKYIADELPNSLEAEISGGNQLIMNYEQAQELFGIKFRRWLGIFNL